MTSIHYGGQYGTFMDLIPDLDAYVCKESCENNEDCRACVYNSRTLDCQLFSEVTGDTYFQEELRFTVKQCPGILLFSY